jgi:hypothetical protein
LKGDSQGVEKEKARRDKSQYAKVESGRAKEPTNKAPFNPMQGPSHQ